MSALRVIGVDPGPVPGMVRLDYEDGQLVNVEVVQCTQGVAPSLFARLAEPIPLHLHIGLEQFVVRGRAKSTGKAGQQTRELIGRLIQEGGTSIRDESWHARSAGEVKPWATDERLEAAGLLALTKGMRHAKDAARHALFCAVKDGGVPDPLSKHAHPTDPTSNEETAPC